MSLVSDRILDGLVTNPTDSYIIESATARNNYDGVDMTTSTADVYANNYKYSVIRKFLNETL